ncbi:hypothetical protein [Leptospira noguchii]|uniref:hypothetical protein n=1 Tax=Leptospira noguchii TaxID=28182 RepID=UPI001E5AC23C|nr:hypothetical protein [Leptospira noguchii]
MGSETLSSGERFTEFNFDSKILFNLWGWLSLLWSLWKLNTTLLWSLGKLSTSLLWSRCR